MSVGQARHLQCIFAQRRARGQLRRQRARRVACQHRQERAAVAKRARVAPQPNHACPPPSTASSPYEPHSRSSGTHPPRRTPHAYRGPPSHQPNGCSPSSSTANWCGCCCCSPHAC
ncbi:hypothetical protein B0H10DRAFT_2005656 [Mycena sp. CBHHK59/15]|nr:hypothetical protein B0H10DRAFT_2005507 [Mycena sp. CBHHK59/15]KAJ6624686.1 hypothetical protein B0H10DRAFT_2005656 [Mycena sp. CBHHK59/15]